MTRPVGNALELPVRPPVNWRFVPVPLKLNPIAGTPCAAVSAARPSAPAELNRSAGDFAMACRITASNSAGTSGRRVAGAGGGSFTCAHIARVGVSRGNGTSPVSALKSTHPSA